MKTRRQIPWELALAVPLFAAWKTDALASVGLAALDRWASDVVALNMALAAGDIGLLDWQGRIAGLNTSVPVGTTEPTRGNPRGPRQSGSGAGQTWRIR